MKRIVVVFWFCLSLSLVAQSEQKVQVELLVLDEVHHQPLLEVVVVEDSLKLQVKTNHKGIAQLRLPINGNYQLHLYKETFENKSHILKIGELPVFDTIVMTSNPVESDFISSFHTSLESFFDGVDDSLGSYLNLGRDVFNRKSAFDWGSSFFNRRGLRSSSRKVLINGIAFNKIQNGNAQWGQWGGLNDFFRNQEQTQPLAATNFESSLGLGITSIDLNPFLMRKAKRISTSLSDKSYQGRLMMSIVDEFSESFRYAFGGSIRFGTRGYKQGTPYEAFSFAAHIAKQWNEQHSSSLHFFKVDQEGAKASALSKEVVELLGSDYNPNWGFQNGMQRSAKLGRLNYSTLLFSHQGSTRLSEFKLSLMAQRGSSNRTRLHYDTTENPNPIYYKKLPSYYINNFLGANFIAAQSAALHLKNQPQLAWDEFYTANQLHPNYVHYALVGDVEKEYRWSGFVGYEKRLLKGLSLALSLVSNTESYQNYARVEDLLGGSFLRDLNPFDQSLNDIKGPLLKDDREPIQYNYRTMGQKNEAQSIASYQSNRWFISFGTQWSSYRYERDRMMINERFRSTSRAHKNKLEGNQFSSMVRYAFDARNFIEFHRVNYKRPTSISQYFVNPRENNRTLEASSVFETAHLNDISYEARWRNLQARLSAFTYRFNGLTNNHSNYIDTAFGSVFVQAITTDVSTLHKGIEGGFNLKLSPVVELEGAFSIGSYTFSNNPSIVLELFDEIGINGVEIVNNLLDLGKAKLKGYRLGNGPQEAFSLSISYRDPSYWFSSLSFNRISMNYIEPSSIRFTDSFLFNEEDLTSVKLLPGEMIRLRNQEVLKPYFITNFLFGKSYLKNKKYFSVFLSVDNLLATNFNSGGYESSRFGNYKDYLNDHQSSTPMFPTKYWWGSSRRFYLNLTLSLP